MDLNFLFNLARYISFKTLFRWFKDEGLRLLFKNAGTLLSGNMIAWILGLITFAITARILGPTQFGILVLITTYVTIVDKILNFQSWQALIKYGAEVLEKKNNDSFKSIVKFCTLLDVATAVLGTIVSIMAVSWVGQWLSWESETVLMAAIYSLVILFNVSGTPTGLLRIFSRFRLFAVQNIVTATIKFVGILIIYFTGASLWLVLILWMMTTIIGHLLLVVLGWRELHKRGFEGTFMSPIRDISTQHPGIWGFVLTTNLNSSIRLGSRELDTMLVGGFVGVEGAGLYKIAKQIAAVPAMLSDPLYQAIYPDLSRLWAKQEITTFKKLMIRSSLIAGGGATVIWFAFILFGSLFIQLVFGPEFVAAQTVTVLYMFAMVISIYAIPLQPAMLSMGKPKTSTFIQIICTVIYLLILFLLLPIFGINGAGIAAIIFYAMILVTMSIVEKQLMMGSS